MFRRNVHKMPFQAEAVETREDCTEEEALKPVWGEGRAGAPTLGAAAHLAHPPPWGLMTGIAFPVSVTCAHQGLPCLSQLGKLDPKWLPFVFWGLPFGILSSKRKVVKCHVVYCVLLMFTSWHLEKINLKNHPVCMNVHTRCSVSEDMSSNAVVWSYF